MLPFVPIGFVLSLVLIAVGTAFRQRIGLAMSLPAALIVLSLASAGTLSYDFVRER